MSINAAYFLEKKKSNVLILLCLTLSNIVAPVFGQGSLYNSESALSEDACIVVSQTVTFSFFGRTF